MSSKAAERPKAGTQAYEDEKQVLFARSCLQDAIRKYEGVSETRAKQDAVIQEKHEEVAVLHRQLLQRLQEHPQYQTDPRFSKFLNK